MNRAFLLLPLLASIGLGCTVDAGDDASPSSEQALTEAPSITFNWTGQPIVSGSIVGGGTVKVAYDYHRLFDKHPECVESGEGSDKFGGVQMGFKLNGDSKRVHYFQFVSGFSDSSLGQPRIRDEIPLAGDVHSLELWFSCGANAHHDQAYDSRNGANYSFAVGAPPAATRDNTKLTGIGNTFDVSVQVGNQVDQNTTYYRPYTVRVSYDDLRGFAGSDYEQIHAWIGVTTHRIGKSVGAYPPKTEGRTITLTREGPRFVGSFELQLGGYVADSDTRLDGLEFAFSNDQGSWDSNHGANYKVQYSPAF